MGISTTHRKALRERFTDTVIMTNLFPVFPKNHHTLNGLSPKNPNSFLAGRFFGYSSGSHAAVSFFVAIRIWLSCGSLLYLLALSPKQMAINPVK